MPIVALTFYHLFFPKLNQNNRRDSFFEGLVWTHKLFIIGVWQPNKSNSITLLHQEQRLDLVEMIEKKMNVKK